MCDVTTILFVVYKIKYDIILRFVYNSDGENGLLYILIYDLLLIFVMAKGKGMARVWQGARLMAKKNPLTAGQRGG